MISYRWYLLHVVDFQLFPPTSLISPFSCTYCWRFLFAAVYLLLFERVFVRSIFILALFRCFRRSFRCLSVLSNQSCCLRFGFLHTFSAVLYTTILRAFLCNSTSVFCSRTSLSFVPVHLFFQLGLCLLILDLSCVQSIWCFRLISHMCSPNWESHPAPDYLVISPAASIPPPLS